MAAPKFTLDESLELRISCATHDDYATRRTHSMTLNPDWTFEVPHDLENESAAAVFGARLSCLDLPKAIEAVRLHVALNLRRAWYDILPLRGSWSIGERRRAPAVSRPTVHLAAMYVHSPRFAASCHRVPAWQVSEMSGQLPWTEWWDRPSASELLGPHPRIAERGGLELLWEAGIHPDTVASIAPEIGPGPHSADLLIHRAYRRYSAKQIRRIHDRVCGAPNATDLLGGRPASTRRGRGRRT